MYLDRKFTPSPAVRVWRDAVWFLRRLRSQIPDIIAAFGLVCVVFAFIIIAAIFS